MIRGGNDNPQMLSDSKCHCEESLFYGHDEAIRAGDDLLIAT